MTKTADIDKDIDEKLEKADYVLRDQTAEERDRLETTEDVPEYRIDIDLNDDQKKRLTDLAFLQFEALEAERAEIGLEALWKERDAQYDGELETNKAIPFNLHQHQSKIKTDAICRSIKEAFLDVEPIVDVSPRPDMERKDGRIVCDHQAEFIDYAMDEEVKPEAAFDKIFKCMVKKFVGIGKLCWSYRRERRKRDESYEGTPEGVDQFLKAFPETTDPNSREYRLNQNYLKRLMRGEKINIVTHYNDTINNNAELKYIRVEDFWVRNGCNYWEGLRTEHFIAESQKYTYWELKEKQDNEEFENIEQLWAMDSTKESTAKPDTGASQDFMVRNYDVLECTMYFKLDESDDEEVKVKAWFSREKKIFLGCILYPYYAIDVDYIPFYGVLNEYGFYGNVKSIMADLRDSNIAIDVLLNLALYGLYLRNTLTPITYEGSNVEAMFSEKRWEAGNPLILDELTDDIRKGIDFVQWPNVDMNTTLAAIEMLKRDQSDLTVSDLTSGRESSLDPTAPAAKTMALLEQSGLGVKEYIRTMLPSFNVFCANILQIYYQMSQEDGKKYKVRRKAEGVTGSDPFISISRDEMRARTTIQARASSFVFDKVNEKVEATANLNVVRTDPYLMQQPEFQFKALKTYFDTMGGRWKALGEQLLSPEAFKNQQMAIAAQAIVAYMQLAAEQAKVTGVPPQIDPNQIVAMMTQAQAQAYNPALAPEAEGKK